MKKLTALLLIMILVLSCMMSVSAEETKDIEVPNGYISYYTHICTLDNEEKTDYMLLYPAGMGVDDCHYWKYFGDYVIRNTEGVKLEYFVYLIESDEIITLDEAIKNNVPCIESIFTDYGLGELLGDMDDDMELTIVDATIIQRCLSYLSEFPLDDEMIGYYGIEKPNDYGWSSYISDYDRDGKRTVLDATAIQKKLANIEDSTVAE